MLKQSGVLVAHARASVLKQSGVLVAHARASVLSCVRSSLACDASVSVKEQPDTPVRTPRLVAE